MGTNKLCIQIFFWNKVTAEFALALRMFSKKLFSFHVSSFPILRFIGRLREIGEVDIDEVGQGTEDDAKVVPTGQSSQVELKCPKKTSSQKNRSSTSFKQIMDFPNFLNSQNMLVSNFRK